MNKITIHNADLVEELEDDGDDILDRGMGRKRKSLTLPFKKTQRGQKLQTQWAKEAAIHVEQFNNTLNIGAIIRIRLDHIVPDYSGKLGLYYPVLVTGVWRDEAGEIKKLEAASIRKTDENSFINNWELAINYERSTPDLKKHAATGKIDLATMLLIDNNPQYVEQVAHSIIDRAYWPDIIARRAAALLHKKDLQFYIEEPKEKSKGKDKEEENTAETILTREGMTFYDIQPWNVRSGQWYPDLEGGDFNRINNEFAHPSMVKEIARHVTIYTKNATGLINIPPFKNWNMKHEFIGFRDWEYQAEIQALGNFTAKAISECWDHSAKPELIRGSDNNAAEEFAMAAEPASETVEESAIDPNAPAFGNDLQIGRVVYCRMKEALSDYEKDDIRPMLVTGLWRDGQDIQKIELMNFTTKDRYQGYPQTFDIQTPKILKSFKVGSNTYLPTDTVYIFNNSKSSFPRNRNLHAKQIDEALWPEILVRRAFAIMLSGYNRFKGDIDLSLEREGFEFRTIPRHAVLGNEFTPEVETGKFPSKATNILPQDAVDMIAAFSVAYSLHVGRNLNFFSFPPVKDWPLEIGQVDFPDWRKVAGGRTVSAPSPQLP